MTTDIPPVETNLILGNGYVPGPGGLGPRFWLHETSGVLKEAIKEYFSRADVDMTEAQLHLVCRYVIHWAHAPCWGDYITLREIRHDARRMRTAADVAAIVHRMVGIGIDPF